MKPWPVRRAAPETFTRVLLALLELLSRPFSTKEPPVMLVVREKMLEPSSTVKEPASLGEAAGAAEAGAEKASWCRR